MTEDKKPSAAARLARIAQDRYTFARTPEGQPFGLPLYGPRIVKLLRGSDSLRAELSAAYLSEIGAPPPQQALTDALMALEGIALSEGARELHLRVARHDGDLWIDLGDDTGEVVRVDRHGWVIEEEAPVLHRRTALTAPLTRPADLGDLEPLWELLNVAETDRGVLLAYLVASWIPDIPHPVLLLTGEQGTGKSSASKIITSLVDPSTVPLRKTPRDLDSWTTAALGSHVVAVDNLSTLPDWLSDALCRASTGDGDVKRKLYTDGDLHVFSFRRVVLLNGIDLGAVRDDLADRLVTVDLHRIAEYRSEKALVGAWLAGLPTIIAGLLDLTAQVLDVLPGIDLERMPRMADFAQVLAAVDKVTGSNAVERYSEQAGELANDAVTSDPVLAALTAAVDAPWRGAAADLLDLLDAGRDDPRPPKGWPSGARALAIVLKRRAPSLRRLGWVIDQSDERSKRGAVWVIEPPKAGDEMVTKRVTKTEPVISSPVRHPVRHPLKPASGTEVPPNGDEVTNETPSLSVQLGKREEEDTGDDTQRDSPFSSSPRHPTCSECHEPLAAADIAEGQTLHGGCAGLLIDEQNQKETA